MSNSSSRGNNVKLKQKIDAFKVNCCAAGLKMTPQRMAVYKALIETNEHPSVPNISLDTVYRTLGTLNEIGVASIVEGSGDIKRFDGNLNEHQHFKCVRCKRIVDFYHKPFDNISVPKILRRRFTVLRKTVYFEGICDLCARK